MSSSVHRRTFGEWISSLINRPYRQADTGWMRKKPVEQPVAQAPVQPPIVQPATTVYPVLPPRPYANGDSVRTYRHSHPVGPTVAPKIVHLTELPKEQYFQATNGMSKETIQNTNTLKRLSPEMFPPQISGQIPVASGMLPNNKEIMERARLGHSTHLEPVPPGQVSQSLWIEHPAEHPPVSAFLGDPNSHSSPLRGSWNAEEQAPPVTPDWLTQEPTLPTRRDSAYLICQTPTLYFWEEFTQLAERKEEDIPTLNLPSITENIAKKYRERE